MEAFLMPAFLALAKPMDGHLEGLWEWTLAHAGVCFMLASCRR